MIRTVLLTSMLLSIAALAAGKPCAPPAADAQVPVKLAAGTTTGAVLEWYQRTTCSKLELGGLDEKATTTLGFSGSIRGLQLDEVVELALASAGIPFRVSRAKAEVGCAAALEGISAKPDGSVVVKRAAFDSAVTADGCLMRTMRVVPAFTDGKPRGFKLFGIRLGSMPEKLGFRNGDVVRSANGHTLDSPERALEAYSALRAAKAIEVELERNGAPLALTIHLE